ncbi:outer membrane beta-barrel protein [Flavicella marina]|uniref:outer membrane beta-barrel protein n=1 Tax=Flavicella marina TaxID=1475951 RepID=UPI001265701C|nr:outer membrane beta-barrel protein [Flavicella marina]
MKKLLLVISLFFITIKSIAQIEFQQGYFVTEKGEKKECLIKNEYWDFCPSEFTYKNSEEGQELLRKIENTKEFRIDNALWYVKHTIDIDQSSNKTSELTTSKHPDFKEETVFLKVLVFGKITLFEYKNQSFTRYFYKTDDSATQQLVYKKYIQNSDIITNQAYKQHLLNTFDCENVTKNDIVKTKYRHNSIVKLFETYNTCFNSSATIFKNKEKSKLIYLSLRPGLSLVNQSYTISESPNEPGNFTGKPNYRFGVELSLVLNRMKNIALILEPTIQQYTNSNSTLIEGIYFNYDIPANYNVNYTSIEIPIGIRYYFKSIEQKGLFVNAQVGFDISISNSNLSVDYVDVIGTDINKTHEFDSYSSLFTFGAGYKLNGKMSLELRYSLKPDLFKSYATKVSKFKSFGLMFGYQL